MPQMQPTPGRHKTRRFEPPYDLRPAKKSPGPLADALYVTHNDAVSEYGSDSGGYLAFDPQTLTSAGVWDGQGGFPANTVVTRLSWGHIDLDMAQQILERDGVE